ncbi:hypothetical protein AEAC466_13685 [Asticcacaulis sp. AC466]|uniref:hypothetical protein n=1 Tax=Asticcacaulis sp. AC466 TaxID=1282362 RepID=UPI0003C3E9DC|nr:hypothetical protein [Asticcacaulis sp. AC466]ESQ83298.1 hypothetical protein AEAC466_13685 [Asticcacaulis sp. AC466]
MPFEGPQKQEKIEKPAKARFSLFDWMVNWIKGIDRKSLTSWLPAFSTACLLVSLLVFSLISYMAYDVLGDGDESLRSFPMVAAFQIGVLITLFLSTLIDASEPEALNSSADPNSDGYRFPFAVSIQANFIEALGITGTIIFLFAKDIIDKIGGDEGELPLVHLAFSALLHLGEGESGKGAEQANTLWDIVKLPEIATLLVLALSIFLALYGFSIIKRKNELESGDDGSGIFTSIFKGKGAVDVPAPTSPKTLELQIDKLEAVHRRLVEKAKKQHELAKDLQARTGNASADTGIADEIARHEGQIAALGAQRDVLTREATEFDSVISTVAALIETAQKRLESSERSFADKLYGRLLGCLSAALNGLKCCKEAYSEFDAKLADDIEKLKAGIGGRHAERERLEGMIQAIEQEATRLESDATELQSRIADMKTLLQNMLADQAAWERTVAPKSWWANVTGNQLVVTSPIAPGTYTRDQVVPAKTKSAEWEKYQTSILWMFLFTVAAGVLDDLLIELPQTGQGGYGIADFPVLLLGLCAFYFFLKFFFPIGFVGSWRSIATAPAKPGAGTGYATIDTRWQETVRVTKWNLVAIVLVLALGVAVTWGVNSKLGSSGETPKATQTSQTSPGAKADARGEATGHPAATEASGEAEKKILWRDMTPAQKWQFVTSDKNEFFIPSIALAFIIVGLILLFPFAIYAIESIQDRLRKAGFIEKILIYCGLVVALIGLVAGLILAALGLANLLRAATPTNTSPHQPPVATTQTVYVDRYPPQLQCENEGISQTINGLRVVSWKFAQSSTLDVREDIKTCKIVLPKPVASDGAFDFVVVVGMASQEGGLSQPDEEITRAGERIRNAEKQLEATDGYVQYQWNLGYHKTDEAKLTPPQTAIQRPLVIITGQASSVDAVKATAEKVLKDMHIDPSNYADQTAVNYPTTEPRGLVCKKGCETKGADGSKP